MKAIRTRFLSSTNTKPSRYLASDSDGNQIVLSTDHALTSDGNHRRAAQALLVKMGWPNQLVGGGYGNDMYWTMIPHDRHAYTLEAGRLVVIDDKPGFYIGCIESSVGPRYAIPSADLDDYARRIVELLNGKVD
jgi:hypothetical protein